MDYYSCYLTGTVFALLSTGMNQFIICQGFAKKGMQSVMLGAVLNIILDPVFIFLLDLGVRGAAIATVLSQLASCLFVLRFLFGPVPPLRITFGGYSLQTMLRMEPEIVKLCVSRFEKKVHEIFEDEIFRMDFCYRMRIGMKDDRAEEEQNSVID